MLLIPPGSPLSSPANPPNRNELHPQLDDAQLWIVGRGGVGSALVKQVQELTSGNSATAAKLTIAGVAHRTGASIGNTTLNGSITDYIERALVTPGSKKILVDCSASADVVATYERVLRSGISIVTPNKLAFSGEQSQYDGLHSICAANGTKLSYSGTVGAGLPIISMLRRLTACGDIVNRVEGVLSGTLSYLFNQDPNRSFYEKFCNARKLGYTEPDPRSDLNGIDMFRKFLICGRECGWRGELSDCRVGLPIAESYFRQESVDEFLNRLRSVDADFDAQRNLLTEGERFAYLGSFDREAGVRLGLQKIGTGHPCYGLRDTENLVAIYTKRYGDRPIVVRGAGAGVEITAGAVLSDILELLGR